MSKEYFSDIAVFGYIFMTLGFGINALVDDRLTFQLIPWVLFFAPFIVIYIGLDKVK